MESFLLSSHLFTLNFWTSTQIHTCTHTFIHYIHEVVKSITKYVTEINLKDENTPQFLVLEIIVSWINSNSKIAKLQFNCK